MEDSDQTVSPPIESKAESQMVKAHVTIIHSTTQIYSVTHHAGMLVTASADRSIKVWDAETSEPLETIEEAHKSWILCLFSDQNYLYSGGADAVVKVWEITSSEGEPSRCIQELIGKKSEFFWVRDIFVQRGIVFVGVSSGAVQLWSRKTWKKLCSIHGHSSERDCYSLVASEGNLFVSSDNTTIRAWDITLTKPACRKVLTGHKNVVLCLAYNSKYLFSGSNDKTIKLFDLVNLEEKASLTGHAFGVWAIQATENLVFSGSYNQTVLIHRIYQEGDQIYGAVLWKLRGDGGRIRDMALLNNKLFAASEDGSVKSWQLPYSWADELSTSCLGPRYYPEDDSASPVDYDSSVLASPATPGPRPAKTEPLSPILSPDVEARMAFIQNELKSVEGRKKELERELEILKTPPHH